MYTLLRKCHTLNLPIDSQLELFDQTVLPILTYGCELWGMENCDMLEQIRLRFLKMVLKLNSKTPNYIVMGETGKISMDSIIKKRMLNFWIKISTGKPNKISRIIYDILKQEQLLLQCKWSSHIKLQLDQLGLGYMWLGNDKIDIAISQNIIDRRVMDQSLQLIHESMQNSNKGKLYDFIKSKVAWEECPFFLTKLSLKEALPILKIRSSNNNFPVELGRRAKIDYEYRKCPFCITEVGDAFHYLLVCKKFGNQRKKYLKKYYYSRPNVEKLAELLNLRSKKHLIKLSVFARELLLAFKG